MTTRMDNGPDYSSLFADRWGSNACNHGKLVLDARTRCVPMLSLVIETGRDRFYDKVRKSKLDERVRDVLPPPSRTEFARMTDNQVARWLILYMPHALARIRGVSYADDRATREADYEVYGPKR